MVFGSTHDANRSASGLFRSAVPGAGAAIAVLLTFGTSAANAATPECGETVTTSVTLTRNLNNCPGNGLVVGAGGITIDLGGHTISGTGVSAGVVVIGELLKVTIKNGKIRGFRDGIVIDGPCCDTIQAIAANDNQAGIDARPFGLFRILDSTANGNTGVGISVANSQGGTVDIADSTANGNGGTGISTALRGNITITDSTANHNRGNGISAGTKDNVAIADSRANGNGEIGIDARALGSASVEDSMANGNGGDGIDISAVLNPTMLLNTLTNGNGGHGIDASVGSSATGSEAHGNKTPPQCVNVMCF